MMSAWKKAGKPSDTGSIINILQGLGMSTDLIGQVGQEQGVDLKSKNVGDPDEPSTTDSPTSDTKATADPAADKSSTPTAQIKPGDTKEIKGKTYKWEGALWTDTSTGKSVGIQSAVNLGLPNPKIDPVVAAIKKAGPNVIKLVVDQINSKGVKAGTAGAQKAKAAGAKGTEELPAAQNEKPKTTKRVAQKSKAGIARPGTVAPKP